MMTKFEMLSRELGWGLIPLQGKVPIEKNWQRWCTERRPFNSNDFRDGRNAGIPCGTANGILVLDIDDADGFFDLMTERGWELPQTREHETGSGGAHLLFQYPNDGCTYGNASFKHPKKVDADGKRTTIFDIRGVGGQVVAPGSIHPDTGREYTTTRELPIAPAPEWMLDLCRQKKQAPPLDPVSNCSLEDLDIPHATRRLVEQGEVKGRRSESIMSVLNAFVRAGADDAAILTIFESHPHGIGEKYFEAGRTRREWLRKQIKKCRDTASGNPISGNVSGRVRDYLLDGEGGSFKLSDLKRELGLNDKDYALARQAVRRMVDTRELEKDGRALGAYRVVNTRKRSIDWDATEARKSNLILPADLHEIATIRDGDMICVAAYKNHSKTAFAIETARLNLNNFKVHFFITEYPARMKQRLLDFGVDLHHPHFSAYQIEKSDYIPDKIESGEGVLNIVDHLPNLEEFYRVGKIQDEIHRRLGGGICLITHQKKKPEDLDAIGGSFWTITPVLAVTLFMEDERAFPGRMLIRKGKEPGNGHTNITGLSRRYDLERGCKYSYDTKWAKQ